MTDEPSDERDERTDPDGNLRPNGRRPDTMDTLLDGFKGKRPAVAIETPHAKGRDAAFFQAGPRPAPEAYSPPPEAPIVIREPAPEVATFVLPKRRPRWFWMAIPGPILALALYWFWPTKSHTPSVATVMSAAEAPSIAPSTAIMTPEAVVPEIPSTMPVPLPVVKVAPASAPRIPTSSPQPSAGHSASAAAAPRGTASSAPSPQATTPPNVPGLEDLDRSPRQP